jgi:hypothetical protein
VVNLKTDKSVHAMWGIFFNPRIEMRGYPESLYVQIQLNLPIYRWGNPPRSYRAVWGIFIAHHVETWGYPARLYGQIQANPLIHQWDTPTHHHNPSSVSTDYHIQAQARGEC